MSYVFPEREVPNAGPPPPHFTAPAFGRDLCGLVDRVIVDEQGHWRKMGLVQPTGRWPDACGDRRSRQVPEPERSIGPGLPDNVHSNSRLAGAPIVCPSKVARTTEAPRKSPLCSEPDRGGDLVDGRGQATCLRISSNQPQLRKCAHILMRALDVTV